jgi:hypothetical protein
MGGPFGRGLDGAAAPATRTALQLAEVQPPLVGHHELAVQHERLAKLGGRGGEVREGAGEVRACACALAGLEHDESGAREEDGPEAVRRSVPRSIPVAVPHPGAAAAGLRRASV